MNTHIPNLPTYNADITKEQLSHRQMVILAQVFLNWSKDPKSIDQKDRLMEWSSELLKTAKEVGVGWEPSNPQQSSVIGYLAQHYEREVDRGLAEQKALRGQFWGYKKFAPEIVVITMLLWALMPFNPYGYYMLLRCVVFAYAGYTLYQMRNTKSWIWFITLGSIALLYNPIYTVHLDRGVWMIINLVTIVLIVLFVQKRFCRL